MDKFLNCFVESHNLALVQCTDKFLQIGVSALLNIYFRKELLTTEVVCKTDSNFFIGDYNSLLKINPKKRLEIIKTARVILFFGKSPYIVNKFSNNENITKIGKRTSVADFIKVMKRALVQDVRRNRRIKTDSKELTGTEQKILTYLAIGKKQYQISEILSLSPKTISYHKMKAMKKLNISTNLALYYWLSLGGLEELISSSLL